MITNDHYDIEVDRVNNPNKPFPTGRISIRTGSIYAVLMLILGMFSAIMIGLTTFIIAVVFAGISWGYNYWGKKKMLLGNMMVAASVAIPYIFGGAAVGRVETPLIWFLALTSFIAATGREVVKTISDVTGDKIRNVKSIASIYGVHTAALVATILFSAAVASTLLPIIIGIVGIVFSTLILIPNAIFIYASLRIYRDNSRKNALKIKNLTLIGMIIGMLVFIFGGLF
jgi:geranylgeranylglycerol-phosphate geranylgeranyltransferase